VIFRQQRKNKFSFTYCTSLAVCGGNGISNVATFDEDFAELDDVNAIDPLSSTARLLSKWLGSQMSWDNTVLPQ
jgi:hypothetical protein